LSLTLPAASMGQQAAGTAAANQEVEPPPPPPPAPPSGESTAPAAAAPACAPGCAPTCDGCASCDDGCGDWCDLGEPWTLKGALFGECEHWLNIGGWWQFGYHNRPNGVFNNHPHRLNLHQWWLYAEKVADGSEGLDWGFRGDLIYGVDAANTQAFGNPPGSWDFQNGFDHGIYGWAIPQLYAELAYESWKLKAGHFFTTAGYEVVPATGNFFYSHAFTQNYSEPFTHTGVLLTYTASDELSLHGGWTAGWDTGFDRFDDGSNFLGGFTYAVTDDLSATYVITLGDLGWLGEGNSHHFVFTWNIDEKWQYVLGSDIVHTNQGLFVGDGYDTVSAANYLFYTINDCMKLGGRAEWWKADGISYYEITGGVNVKPHANVVIRPELRYQWSPAGDGPGGNPVGIPLHGAIVGVDAIFTY
jgi:hypothetical protein